METVLAIDFDKWAAETYAENFPGVDVRRATVESQIDSMPYSDIIIGGPPCQGFSVAGEGKGEKDERNGWPAAISAVAKVRPRMFLFENVAGMMSARHIRYFSRVYADLEKLGYRVEWLLLDSVNYGVPQFRERVWVWGIRADVGAAHCWPSPTHIWPPPTEGLFGEHGLLPGVTVGQALGIEGYIRIERGAGLLDRGGERRDHPTTEPCPMVAAGSKGSGPRMKVIGGGRNHIARGDGHFERAEREITDEPSTTITGKFMGTHKGAQNPRIVEVYDHGAADPAAPCPTIKAGGNVAAGGHQGGGCPPAIAYRWSDAMLAKHPPASPASPASTVQAKFYKGGAEGLLQITDNSKHQPHQPANTLGSGGAGHGMSAANMHLSVDGRTWENRHPPASPAPTVRARSPRDGGRCVESVLKEGLMVRRLTPDECARLMSMPDDFHWPAKITKTAKYKIIGNGQCSLMVHRLGEALRQTDPESRTVISLFCGGGVGDCGLHGRYWRFQPAAGISPEAFLSPYGGI